MGALLEKPVDEALQAGLVSVDVDPCVRLYARHVPVPRIHRAEDHERGCIHKVAIAQAVGTNVPDVATGIGDCRGTVHRDVRGCGKPLYCVGPAAVVIANENNLLRALHFLECSPCFTKKDDISFQFF